MSWTPGSCTQSRRRRPDSPSGRPAWTGLWRAARSEVRGQEPALVSALRKKTSVWITAIRSGSSSWRRSFSSLFFSLCLSPSLSEYFWKTAIMVAMEVSRSDIVDLQHRERKEEKLLNFLKLSGLICMYNIYSICCILIYTTPLYIMHN